jgi:hypothetical protein
VLALGLAAALAPPLIGHEPVQWLGSQVWAADTAEAAVRWVRCLARTGAEANATAATAIMATIRERFIVRLLMSEEFRPRIE